jgi:DNA-binding MarR family transcriptional regulator
MNEFHGGRLEEPDDLLQALIWAGHAVEDRLDAALRPDGLSLPKLGVLRYLVAAGVPLPLGELSARAGCVKSNITQLVDRLEAERLVRRVSDPEDRRSTLAEITPEGRRRHDAAAGALAEAAREVLAGISPAERTELRALVGRLVMCRARPRSASTEARIGLSTATHHPTAGDN